MTSLLDLRCILLKYLEPFYFWLLGYLTAYFRFPTLPVTRHLRFPDHFLVQLFSYTPKKKNLRKIMLSFPLINAQGRSFTKFEIVLLDAISPLFRRIVLPDIIECTFVL